MKIGIDLLWVRPQKNGGGESYIRNLLDGFEQYSQDDFEYILFVTKDNAYSFEHYFACKRFQKAICDVSCEKSSIRILWENINLNRIASRYNLDLMFVPVYSKPLYRSRKIKYVITVHDLQAIHFPEYFSKIKNIWLRFAWKNCIKTSDEVVAISNFVKNDIISQLNIKPNKINLIYNPIITIEDSIDFDQIKDIYNISKKNYFYTVSSMLPHKNLKTILLAIKKLKENEHPMLRKLVISGITATQQEEFYNLAHELRIEDQVILTGYISNEVRDCLYKNAQIFVFPSIFEGFGMPPIEAMRLGTPVVTTDIEVLKEITDNKAIYVKDYYDADEWISKIEEANNKEFNAIKFTKYSLENTNKQYLSLFRSMSFNKEL